MNKLIEIAVIPTIVALGVIYFFPIIVACQRKHHQRMPISRDQPISGLEPCLVGFSPLCGPSQQSIHPCNQCQRLPNVSPHRYVTRTGC